MKRLFFILGLAVSIGLSAQITELTHNTYGSQVKDRENTNFNNLQDSLDAVADALGGASGSYDTTYLYGTKLDGMSDSILVNNTMLQDSLGARFNPVSYGADPTGVTASEYEINLASTAAYNAGGVLYFAPGDEFLIEDSVLLRSHVIGTGALITTADTTYPAMVFWDADGNDSWRKTLYLPNIYCSNHANGRWSIQEGHIGLKVVNANACTFYIPYVQNFRYGILVTSYGVMGSQYNNFFPTTIIANYVNWKQDPVSITGWTNQNNVFGGQFASFSNDGTDVAGSAHVWIDSSEVHMPNNNNFWGTSFEGNMHYWRVKISGRDNAFNWCRWEADEPRVYQFKSGAVKPTTNRFSGYQASNIEFIQDDNTSVYETIWDYATGIHIAGSSDGPFVGSNSFSDNNGVYYALSVSDSIDVDQDVKYGWRAGVRRMESKAVGDTEPRIRFQNNTGAIYLGSGSSTPDVYIDREDPTTVEIHNALKLTPTASPPASATAGVIYMDTDNHLYVYNGSTWVQLDN